ncbi:MAG: hypothetical protein ACTSWN_00870 [Promethearchaeota archaeon]
MIPRVKLESLELSRLICGSNPFCGISHFTPSRDLFFREYFTVDRIAEIMSYILEEFGVNCILSSPRDEIYEAINMVEKETGDRYAWLCTPGHYRGSAKGLGNADIFEQIKWCADHGVEVCMPHRSYTDAYMNTSTRTIEGIPEITAAIRDAGMIPGLSSHYHEVISIVEKQAYDIPVIIQPLNVLGFQSNVEVNTLMREIKRTRVQIINIKPLAAGRILPEVGLDFCFRNIKDHDFVCCGFSCIHDADYDCQFVEILLKR